MSFVVVEHKIEQTVGAFLYMERALGMGHTDLTAGYRRRWRNSTPTLAQVKVRLTPSDVTRLMTELLKHHNANVRDGKAEGPEVELVERKPITPPANAKWEFDIPSPVYADDDASAEAMVADLDRTGIYYERSEIIREGKQ